jgi:hypothetical protein
VERAPAQEFGPSAGSLGPVALRARLAQWQPMQPHGARARESQAALARITQPQVSPRPALAPFAARVLPEPAVARSFPLCLLAHSSTVAPSVCAHAPDKQVNPRHGETCGTPLSDTSPNHPYRTFALHNNRDTPRQTFS